VSCPELQTEEKAVQLLSEDILILSEYSWDMTGYTSRFGYFYLGNTKADVEELTRWQAEHIFQLTPTPSGMEDAFPNIEKGNHISKEKRKEILKKNEAVGDEYLIRAVEEKNFSISVSSSMHMNTGSMQRCITSSEGTEWIPTTPYSSWI